MKIWAGLTQYGVRTVALPCEHSIDAAVCIKGGILCLGEEVLTFVKDGLQFRWFSRFLLRMYLVTGKQVHAKTNRMTDGYINRYVDNKQITMIFIFRN